MPFFPRGLLGVLTIALVACAAGDEPNAGGTPEQVAGDPVANSSPPLPPNTAAVISLNDSEVTGEISVIAVDGGTSIVAVLTGVLEGESILGHIHPGTCPDEVSESTVVASLGPFEIGLEGWMSAVVPVPLDDLRDGRFVGFHRADGPSHIACASFPPGID